MILICTTVELTFIFININYFEAGHVDVLISERLLTNKLPPSSLRSAPGFKVIFNWSL